MPAITDGKRNAASYTGTDEAGNLQMENFTVPALVKVVMRGMGQIMLQENALTGFLFLAGIFYGSAYMGFAALAAVVTGAWMVFSVVLCTAISLLFFKFALIQLTFPFVAAAFLTLTIRGILKKSKSTRQKILKINRLITKTLL